MSSQSLSWLRSTAGSLLLLGGLASVASAQQATITGRVTVEGSGAPIIESRVLVVGTNLVASTNAQGQYTLRGVPAGPQEIRVIRVGFLEQKKGVTVPASGTVTVDFSLRQAVVQLQEIVTTATGQQQRSEIGATIATVNVADRVSEGGVTNMSDLLVGKAPGANVLPGSMTGTAGPIRLRGINSMSLSNEPIWIVDGVRFNSGTVGVQTGGQRTSLLNSLNPEEIETIEVVKGPAAATLYGTGAANGVIVVTTKRGRADETRWDWYTEHGLIKDRGDYPDAYMIWGHAPSAPNTQRRCELVHIGAGTCVQDSVTTHNPLRTKELTPLQTGYRSQYGGQVSGGTARLRYFVSGEWEQETGPMEMPEVDVARFRQAGTPIRDEWMNPERLSRGSARANLNAAVTDKFDLSVSTMYARTSQRLTQTDNNVFSVFYQSMMNPGFRGPGPGRTDKDGLGQDLNGNASMTIGNIFQELVQEDIHRFVGSVNGNWRPLSWLTADGTLGMDLADRRNFNLCRFNECAPYGTTRLGFVSSQHTNNRNLSARFVTTANWQLNDALNLRSTLGVDYTNIGSDGTSSAGQQLPPGAQTVGAAAVVTSGGSTLPTATKTLGYVLQERLSINDRLFITASARSDKNSAFGVNYKNAIYPSGEISWVASDEEFFPQVPGMSYFRLRAAYGTAGVNPGATQAMYTYSSPTVNIDGSETPGLRASQIGNPNLKPEVSTEFETGFDTRLLDERVSVDFTFYRKKTKDALLSQPIAPSSGASDLTVLRNIGAVQNQGFEASINASLVNTESFGWDVSLAASTNKNKILSLGIDPATGKPDLVNFTGTIRDSVGMPVNGRYNRPYTYEDANNNGIIEANEVTVDPLYYYMGSSIPGRNASLTSSFDLLNRRLRLTAMLDYKGDYIIENVTDRFLCVNSAAAEGRSNPNASLEEQARCVAAARGTPTTTSGYFEDGSFVRLREVSATFNMPESITRLARAGNMTLSLSGRNLALWTNYTGNDPEANYGVENYIQNIASSSPRTFYTLRLNLSY